MNGKVLEELHNVIVDSFAEDEFKRLLAYKLNQETKRWVGDAAGLDRLVEVTLDKAKREGWLRRLVEVVSEARSDRPDVQKACNDVAAVLQPKSSSWPASRPADSLTPSPQRTPAMDRPTLVRTLNDLTPADFATLIVMIPGAARQVSRQGTVPEQASELIRWAESSKGPGLGAVEEALGNFR